MRRTVDASWPPFGHCAINDLAPGVEEMGATAVHMDPSSHFWIIEQDRERAMTRRALERAAREGGAQHPGQDRGAISGFVRVLQNAVATIHIRPAGPGRNARLSGPSGA